MPGPSAQAQGWGPSSLPPSPVLAPLGRQWVKQTGEPSRVLSDSWSLLGILSGPLLVPLAKTGFTFFKPGGLPLGVWILQRALCPRHECSYGGHCSWPLRTLSQLPPLWSTPQPLAGGGSCLHGQAGLLCGTLQCGKVWPLLWCEAGRLVTLPCQLVEKRWFLCVLPTSCRAVLSHFFLPFLPPTHRGQVSRPTAQAEAHPG